LRWDGDIALQDLTLLPLNTACTSVRVNTTGMRFLGTGRARSSIQGRSIPNLHPPHVARMLQFVKMNKLFTQYIGTQCDLGALSRALDWAAAAKAATPWVQAVRQNPPPFWAMESLLKEYPISSVATLVRASLRKRDNNC